MKKFQKLFMAVAAVAAVGCTTDVTEDLGVNLNGGQTTLTLSLDDTRTQLGEKADGAYPLTWAAGDAISVNGSVSNALAADEAGATSATFNFEKGFGSAPYFVAYPATSTNNQVVFAAKQTHVSNTTFGNGAAVMYGYATDLNSITLSHLTGVLKIGVVSGTATHAYIKEVRISTVDRKPIAGAFNVDAEGKLTPVKDATSEVITYKSESDTGFLVLPVAETNPVTYIYVAVPAGVYGELYVTLESADGVMYKTIKTDSTKPLNAGNVREFSNNIAFVPVAETETFVIADYYDLLDFQQAINNAQATMDNAEATEDAKTAAAATLAKSAVLVNDIEIPTAVQPGYEWAPINAPSYTGTITGNGYAIKNLTTPLFVKTAASFKGLHLVVAVNETANPNFGAFARQLVATETSTVEHCSVSGTIKINTNSESTITKIDNICEENATGCLVGMAMGDILFKDCVNNASLTIESVTTTSGAFAMAAGIVGFTDIANEKFVDFTNCTNNGDITINDTTDNISVIVGGIVASYSRKTTEVVANATFDNVCNNGDITFSQDSKHQGAYIGGIIGYMESHSNHRNQITFKTSTINNGEIETNGTAGFLYIGGIVGNGNRNTFSFYDTVTNNKDISVYGTSKGLVYVGGLIGYNNLVPMNFYGKEVVNKGNITLNATVESGICGLAGHMGYAVNMFLPFQPQNECSIINEGNITVEKDSSLYDLALGGIGAYIHASSNNSGGHPNAVDGGIVKYINYGKISVAQGVTASSEQQIGGIFGYSHMGMGNGLYWINTGDIELYASFNQDKINQIGGIVGRIGTPDYKKRAIDNAQCHCKITAYYVDKNGTEVPYTSVGMLTGRPANEFVNRTNCHIGGTIVLSSTNEIKLTSDNYLNWVAGGNTTDDQTNTVKYLESKDSIVY